MTPPSPANDAHANHTRMVLFCYGLASAGFSLTYVLGRPPVWPAFLFQHLEAALFGVAAWWIPRQERKVRPWYVAAVLFLATGFVLAAAIAAGEGPLHFLMVLPLLVALTLPEDLLPVVSAAVSCSAGAAAIAVFDKTVHSPGSQMTMALIVAIGATFGAHRYVDTRRRLEELHRLRQEQADQQRLATVGEAAAAVAHEVRNPLGAISNAVALIRNGVGDSRPLLEMIREEVGKLERFVTDLLVLARPFAPRTRTLDLAKLMQRCARIAGEPATGNTIVLKGPTGEASASADPDLLEIALINLMRNALQASPQGTPVTVEFWAARGVCMISVEDEGPGVAEEHRARLFEPFFTTKQTGTGLGLAITKRVVSAHQGQIHLRSTRTGRGSRFEIELPQP